MRRFSCAPPRRGATGGFVSGERCVCGNLHREHKKLAARGYLRAQVKPSALVQCSPLSVVISKRTGISPPGGACAEGLEVADRPSIGAAGGAGATIIDCVTMPTGRERFATLSPAAATATRASCVGLKPGAAALTSYAPGARPRTTKRPAESVFAARAARLVELTRTTDAPGMTAPVASVTMPDKLPFALPAGGVSPEKRAPAVRVCIAQEAGAPASAVEIRAAVTARPIHGARTAFQCFPASLLTKTAL